LRVVSRINEVFGGAAEPGRVMEGNGAPPVTAAAGDPLGDGDGIGGPRIQGKARFIAFVLNMTYPLEYGWFGQTRTVI